MLIVMDQELEKANLRSHRISGTKMKQEDVFCSDLVTIKTAYTP